ncbi:MAG: hypothetical protein RIM84_18590 [Alphaproteobacteria bacterium]
MTNPISKSSDEGKSSEEKKPIVDGVREGISKWSIRAVGYAMVGSSVAAFADVKRVETFFFGEHGMPPMEGVAVLAVGGALVIGGEFLANYIESLKQTRQFRKEIAVRIKSAGDEFRTLNSKLDDIVISLGHAADEKNETFKTEGPL